MRFKDTETKNIDSKTALYVDGAMEFQVISLVSEYGAKINGMRYAVASRHTEIDLKVIYGERLKGFSPFLYMTAAQGEAILESQRNEDSYKKRGYKHDAFDYDDELISIHHKSAIERNDLRNDPESMLIDEINRAEYLEWRTDAIERIAIAMGKLTQTQRERFIKHVGYGKTIREIAKEENVAENAVFKSVHGAIKKIKKNI